MLCLALNNVMLAIFDLSGGELILVLFVILILFGAKRIPWFARGLGEGITQFWKQLGELLKEFDHEAHDAGKSLGGIYGRPAAQALTADNQTAELYDPEVFRRHERTRRARPRSKLRAWGRWWRRIWRSLLNRFKRSHPEI